MVKKDAKTKAKIQQEAEYRVDNLARVLQIFALILAGILTIVDIAVKDYELPIWLVPAILGIAAGLSPEQIAKIITDSIKTFISGKRQR